MVSISLLSISHFTLFSPTEFTIDSIKSPMDPFCLKLQVERGSHIPAYTGGVHSSIGIQREQATNPPIPLANPEIQPEACMSVRKGSRWNTKLHSSQSRLAKLLQLAEKKSNLITSSSSRHVPYPLQFLHFEILCQSSQYMSFLLSHHMKNLQEMVPATKTWNHRWVVL